MDNQSRKDTYEHSLLLKPGGIFIFSWEHPLFSRVHISENGLLFNKPYHEEGAYDHEAWKLPVIMQQLKISTYVNTLVETGFKIERIIEEIRVSEDLLIRDANRWYNWDKVKAVPTTIIFKCEKR
ncbi:hypothetical protein [Mesobacillus jeotgali]|uniref:hypothetical protein n=1 Tax=Mesobacillus jeotgali TaxID=129985 RepID=UPI0021476A48|nr:hypothetical protein [Mesobacillus jeotgali]